MANKRRGQAALEFLTTYGWAFMIILVMIGALAYFGVLNPRNLVPDSCAIQAGFTCSDYEVTSSSVGMVLTNNLGRSVNVSNMNVTLNGVGILSSACSATPSIGTVIPDGSRVTWTCSSITANTLVSGEKVKLGYNFDYMDVVGGTFLHKVSGTLTATVR